MKHVKEYTRKSIHLIFGIIFLTLIYNFGANISIQIIGACLILGIIVSLLMKYKIQIPFLGKIVANVERENEKKLPGTAAIMFFISAIILLVIFQDNKTIILASLSRSMVMRFAKQKTLSRIVNILIKSSGENSACTAPVL